MLQLLELTSNHSEVVCHCLAVPILLRLNVSGEKNTAFKRFTVKALWPYCMAYHNFKIWGTDWQVGGGGGF